MKYYLALIFKGIGMGAANVIPGVSGGTIALITGIFEELIDSIKSFDIKAIKLLFTGRFKEFAEHINLYFLLSVFTGIGISIFSLAVLLRYLFENYRIDVWAFFFGLILASVYFVGKTVKKWSISVIIIFIIGTVIAMVITVLNPATENPKFLYLFLCGIISVCSMILPGLSGSFILILLGNYELVMINAVADMQIKILFPVVIGAAIGLIAFSHVLSYVFKKFRDQTISLLTGFILGSLAILWPWKNEIPRLDEMGNPLLKSDGKIVIQGYDRYIPDSVSQEVMWAIFFMIMGIITIWFIEKYAQKQTS